MTVRARLIGEVLVALGFVALAGVVLQQTNTDFVEQGASSGGAMTNAALYPELLAAGMILLAIAQIVGAVRRARAAGAAPSAPSPAEPGATPQALACFAAFTLYLLSLRTLGYHVATPVMLFAMFALLGVRLPLAALLGVAVSLTMSLFFELGLNVILPVGRFGIGF